MTEPDALDRRIDAAARSYHAPGDPPLDAIWSRIEGDVAAALQAALADELAARRRGRVLRWAASAAALAASFAVGMIAGRAEDAPLSAPAPVAEAPAPSPPPAVAAPPIYRRAAGRHFTRVRTGLGALEQELARGRITHGTDDWSRRMLAETRILLDGPAGSDPRAGPLLREVEGLLAEIAALESRPDSLDAGLARRTLAQTRLAERLRAAGET